MAFEADADFSEPSLGERTLGDYLDPTRTASAIGLVNSVEKMVETEAAEWPIVRLREMYVQLEREQQERNG